MIEKHIQLTEKINQLETINQQLRNELNQVLKTDQPT